MGGVEREGGAERRGPRVVMRLFMLLECCKVATQCDEDREMGDKDNKNKSHARMSVCVAFVCDSCV